MTFYQLYLAICLALFLMALFHWRQHPCVKAVLKFRRPFWVLLYISVGVFAFGLIGGNLMPPSFDHLDPKGLRYIPFLVLAGVGILGCCVSFAWFLGSLIASILSYVHARQAERTKQS